MPPSPCGFIVAVLAPLLFILYVGCSTSKYLSPQFHIFEYKCNALSHCPFQFLVYCSSQSGCLLLHVASSSQCLLLFCLFCMSDVRLVSIYHLNFIFLNTNVMCCLTVLFSFLFTVVL